MRDLTFCEERPDFETLVTLWNKAKTLTELVTALAEEHDVCQRASDLHYAAKAFSKSVDSIVIQSKE